MPYRADGIGHQDTDTSAIAAEGVSSRAASLRAMVLNVLEQHPEGMDSAQIAAAIGCEYCSVQPRTAELRMAAKIKDSGKRGVSQYGRPTIVWVHHTHAQQ